MDAIVVRLAPPADEREAMLDQLDLTRPARRAMLRTAAAFGAAIALVLAVALGLGAGDLLVDPYLLAFLALMAGMLAWGLVRARRDAHERVRTWSERWSAPTYRFDSFGVQVEDDGMLLRFPWAHVRAIEETPRLVLVRLRQDLLLWLPRRLVDAAALRRLRAAA